MIFKEYFKYLREVMRNGGLVVALAMALVLVPFTAFVYFEIIKMALLWFLVMTPLVASFLAFYFVDYRKIKEKKEYTKVV